MLEKLKWNKRKATTGKVGPSPQFLAEEKFSFQRNKSALVTEHDIPPCMIVNIDQTPLSDVNTGKYTFSFKDAKLVPIRGVDYRRQITATFTISCTGDFLPLQLIYSVKTKRSLPKFSFPPSFPVTFRENHSEIEEICRSF